MVRREKKPSYQIRYRKKLQAEPFAKIDAMCIMWCNESATIIAHVSRQFTAQTTTAMIAIQHTEKEIQRIAMLARVE